MFDERSLTRLSEEIAPSDAQRQSMKAKIMKRVHPDAATLLREASATVHISASRAASLKERILSRLEPLSRPVWSGSLKWAAAFALFFLVIRALPVLFLAPSTRADLAVQLIPQGDGTEIYVGGVWQNVSGPQLLAGPTMIQTGDKGATIILNDDGVLRLEPHTTLKLHDTADRSAGGEHGPTATVIRGQLWALGLIPPFIDGIGIEVPGGVVSLNTGSVGIETNADAARVRVFDRGATVSNSAQTVFLVAGEGVKNTAAATLPIISLPESAFIEPWVSMNLEQDAVHRTEIAKLQEARRASAAGILPTSFFYPAKRIAEEVDVLFTLSQDGRAGKRFEQANTRLKEALALMKEGEGAAASAPLAEYKSSLIAMASDVNDNLVKHVVRQQIADASTGIGIDGESAAANIELLTQAVNDVSSAIPDADLKPEDIEGYILVDRLARINRALSHDKDTEAAALAYTDVQPYLRSLLGDTSAVNPLLKKEATALLVSTSSLIAEATNESLDEKEVLATIENDIAQYLPDEKEGILLSEEELTAHIEQIVERILLFRHPTSRYNQLIAEMRDLETDPNRGTLLRRLKAALPEGLGEYVNTEIHELRDELLQGE